MTIHASLASVALLASISLPSSTFAQNVPTSDRRIPVRKGDAAASASTRTPSNTGSERERLRATDSLARQRASADSFARLDQRRVDSLETVRRRAADSIAAVDRARLDSLERASRTGSTTSSAEVVQPPINRSGGWRLGERGWYMGLSAGGTAPIQDFRDLGYSNGYTIHVPIGWHSRSSPLGARLDLGYSQFQGRTFVTARNDVNELSFANSDPSVLSAMLNVTLGVPIVPSRAAGVYAVGGAGLQHFRSFGRLSSLSAVLGNDVLDIDDEPFEATRNKLAWQAGAGLDVLFGRASVFLESRIVNTYADRGDNLSINDFIGRSRARQLRWVPITLGVTIR
jgi:opacity protein-like surface antigen